MVGDQPVRLGTRVTFHPVNRVKPHLHRVGNLYLTVPEFEDVPFKLLDNLGRLH